MAKMRRFRLRMEDGAEVLDIDSLRDHFSIESVRGYYHDGRLMEWLTGGAYSKEIDILREIKEDDPELDLKLCQLFDVPYVDVKHIEGIFVNCSDNMYSRAKEFVTCSCGNKFMTEQLLCNKCGKLIQKIPYKIPNKDIPISLKSSEYGELSQLSSFIAEKKWKDGNIKYKEISREIESVKMIAEIARKRIIESDTKERSVYRWIYEKCRKYIDETEDRAVEVAIVENVKFGKSSQMQNNVKLINCIFEKTDKKLSEEDQELSILINTLKESKEQRKHIQNELDEIETQRSKVVDLLEQIASKRKNLAEEN